MGEDNRVLYMRAEDFLRGGVRSTAVERVYERIDWDKLERNRLRRMRDEAELRNKVP